MHVLEKCTHSRSHSGPRVPLPFGRFEQYAHHEHQAVQDHQGAGGQATPRHLLRVEVLLMLHQQGAARSDVHEHADKVVEAVLIYVDKKLLFEPSINFTLAYPCRRPISKESSDELHAEDEEVAVGRDHEECVIVVDVTAVIRGDDQGVLVDAADPHEAEGDEGERPLDGAEDHPGGLFVVHVVHG